LPDIREIRIGTRGSQLALWQARTVAARIAETGGPSAQIVVIKTTGDRLVSQPLAEAGGKRLFVKEIEEALLAGDVDIAVHSSKDLPVDLPPGLVIAGVLPREDPRDAIVLPSGVATRAHASSLDTMLDVLGRTPVVGTGSVRRIAQLAAVVPGARFTPIRGNLDTRLRKLDAGEYDALVLAAAGLHRLGLASRISLALPPSISVPAPGQGIIAVQTRSDRDVRRTIERLHDAAGGAALEAERAVVTALGGGCQTPIGAFATTRDGDMLDLIAAVVAPDGSRTVRGEIRGPRSDAAALGARLGERLLVQGAREILAGYS
jgi:hydroxymethylbilane synthase